MLDDGQLVYLGSHKDDILCDKTNDCGFVSSRDSHPQSDQSLHST